MFYLYLFLYMYKSLSASHIFFNLQQLTFDPQNFYPTLKNILRYYPHFN